MRMGTAVDRLRYVPRFVFFLFSVFFLERYVVGREGIERSVYEYNWTGLLIC